MPGEAQAYRSESAVAFPDCGTAANEPNNEKQGSDSDDHHGRDERVNILKEVVVVVIGDEDISAYIAQNASCPLSKTKSQSTVTSRGATQPFTSLLCKSHSTATRHLAIPVKTDLGSPHLTSSPESVLVYPSHTPSLPSKVPHTPSSFTMLLGMASNSWPQPRTTGIHHHSGLLQFFVHYLNMT